MKNARSVTKLDRDLGQRIRARRIEQKISQADLGEAVGLSFQQIQKYEKGMNRVAAGTLTVIARKLDIPVMQLMSKPDGIEPAIVTPGLAFLTTADGAKIARAWPHITDHTRRVISTMVEGIAGTQMQAAE